MYESLVFKTLDLFLLLQSQSVLKSVFYFLGRLRDEEALLFLSLPRPHTEMDAHTQFKEP